MPRRSNERVFRVRWMRAKWTSPRAASFLSRKKADEHRAKIEAAWPDGTNPLTWTTIDSAVVHWSEVDRQEWKDNAADATISVGADTYLMSDTYLVSGKRFLKRGVTPLERC